jgi:hypothetical protein
MSEVYTQFATSLRAAQEGQLDLLADEGLLENWRGLCESQYVFLSTLYTQENLTDHLSPSLLCCCLPRPPHLPSPSTPSTRLEQLAGDLDSNEADIWTLERNTWALVQALYTSVSPFPLLRPRRELISSPPTAND